MPSILICCPVSKHKDYIFDHWLMHLVNNTNRPHGWAVEIFLSDNTNDGGQWIAEKAKKWDNIFAYSTIEPNTIKECLARNDTYTLLMHSHNQCRDYMMACKHDYMWHLECDILCPPHTLRQLLDHNKLVCGASYMHGYGADRYVLIQTREAFGTYYRNTTNLSYGISDMLMCDGSLKLVHAMGLGCTLIKKDVINQFPFRIDANNYSNSHPDTFFYEDMAAYDVGAWLDTSILCEHYNRKWDEIEFNTVH